MSTLPAELFEREYNLRAAFPDHAQWFARWAADSAAARARLESKLNLRYGNAPGQTIDLFPSAGARGTLLFIHGGYWRSLDKSDHSFVAPPLVERGIGVAVINYDLCPQVSIACIVEQCRDAVAWLRREGPRHGVSAQRLVVAGHSAGGHLAAMLVATDWLARGIPGAIAGAAAISGIFDLEPLLQVSFNSDLKLDAAQARAMSPIHLRPPVPVPLVLAAGADETSAFIRQSWLLWERWTECCAPGREGPLLIAARHHFSVLSDLGDATSALTRALLSVF
jgi:arylformamidase